MINVFMPQYRELLKAVDVLAARLSAFYRGHLVCSPGCSACCMHHLSVFEVEADGISEALADLPAALRSRLRLQAQAAVRNEAGPGEAACPLLVNDLCAIYPARPLICRTQGLPLLLDDDEGAAVVDFCPLNFTAAGAAESLEEAYLVPLEELNARLVWANHAYCRRTGRGAAAGRRILLAEVVLESWIR